MNQAMKEFIIGELSYLTSSAQRRINHINTELASVGIGDTFSKALEMDLEKEHLYIKCINAAIKAVQGVK